MIDIDIKKTIKKLKKILKKDERFVKNGDDKYHSQIRKIYNESKYDKQNIVIKKLSDQTSRSLTTSIHNIIKIEL